MLPQDYNPLNDIDEDEELADIVKPFIEAMKAKQASVTREQAEAERAAMYESLDSEAAEFQERHRQWADALKRWRLPLAILEFDGDYARTDIPHPFHDAFWSGDYPEDLSNLNNGKPISRSAANHIHNRWQRNVQTQEELLRKKRAANLMQYSSMDFKQALDEVDRAHSDDPFGFDAAELKDLLRSFKTEQKSEAPYIDGASIVVQRWRDEGVKLPGVRFDDTGKLPANSKLVRWFKAYCGDKTPKRVTETAQRMAGPKRRWRKDVEAYRAWKD